MQCAPIIKHIKKAAACRSLRLCNSLFLYKSTFSEYYASSIILMIAGFC